MKTEPALFYEMLGMAVLLGGMLGILPELLVFVKYLFCRSRAKKGKLLSFCLSVWDVVFCLLAAFMATVLIFSYNSGVIRGFVLLGMAFGFGGYRALFGGIVRKGAERLATWLRAFAFWLWRRLSPPILRFALKTVRLVSIPWRRLSAYLKERRVFAYDRTQTELLRQTAEKGFVKI